MLPTPIPMPKDPPSNSGSDSRSNTPYPPSFGAQSGRISVSRSGSSSPNATRPPSCSSDVGVAFVANGDTLITTSPRYHSLAQLPSVHGECLVHTPPSPLGWNQRAPPLPSPPPRTLATTRSSPSQGTAQLRASRREPLVDPPNSFAPSSTTQPCMCSLFVL